MEVRERRNLSSQTHKKMFWRVFDRTTTSRNYSRTTEPEGLPVVRIESFLSQGPYGLYRKKYPTILHTASIGKLSNLKQSSPAVNAIRLSPLTKGRHFRGQYAEQLSALA